jgi:MFS family permease
MHTIDRWIERQVSRLFFYGWAIVLVNFITSMITAGIGGYGLSFFIVPMAQDLGVSRAAFSSVSLFRLIPTLVVPFLGPMVDRKHGARVMSVVGCVIAAGTLMFLSRISAIWQFYLGYGVVFGLAMLAFGGQLVGPATLAKWFVRLRGRAMAIGTMGGSAGGFIVAPLVGWLIAVYDWRVAWLGLGVALLVLVVPVSALFMRRSPEDLGMLPDGDSARIQINRKGAQARPIKEEYPWTAKMALRTPAFWLMMVIQLIGMGIISPTLLHQVAYVTDKGFSPATAASVATTLAFGAMLAKLPWGYLAEKLPPRVVFPLCLVPSSLTLLLLIWAHSAWMLYLYAILHGMTIGGWASLSNVVWASYFGRKHMGAIRGVTAPAGNVIGSVSPVLAGLLWDWTGSYAPAFYGFSAAWLLAAVLSLAAKPPVPPEPAKAEPQAAARV